MSDNNDDYEGALSPSDQALLRKIRNYKEWKKEDRVRKDLRKRAYQ